MDSKMLLSTVFFLWTAVCAYALNQIKVPEEDFFPCFNYTACILKNEQELRLILNELGQEGTDRFFNEMRDASGISNLADTPEFWKTYPDTICTKSDEQKESVFKAIGAKTSEFWTSRCENGDTETCERYGKGLDLLGEVVVKYTSAGECGSGSKAKGMTEGMKTPNFGG